MEQSNTLRTRGINSVSNVVKNDYFIAIVTLLAISYVGALSPKLPSPVMSMLDNIIVRFAVFYVIAYVISRKVDVALISSLAVLALLLGLQVYVSDGPTKVSGSTMEKMVGGFQRVLGARQAEVSVDKAGKLMENEPLNEKWVNKVDEVQGYTLDWPGYESVVDQVSEVGSTTTVSSKSASEVVAMNETRDVPKNGEVVGVVNTDLSNLATV